MRTRKPMTGTSKLVFVTMAVAAMTTFALRANSFPQDKQRKPEATATTASAPHDDTIATASSNLPKTSLNVINGNPSGEYSPGTLVVVTADVPAGAKFAGWTGDVAILANPLVPTTTATIPHTAVSITATFTAPEPLQTHQGSWIG
jgi:List-Bact-rpt repeat protein